MEEFLVKVAVEIDAHNFITSESS